MNLREFLKFSFLAVCLYGSAISMESEKKECPHILNSPYMVEDASGIIANNLPFQSRIVLSLTCNQWSEFIKKYHKNMVQFKDFKEININIHPDLVNELETFYEGDFRNFGSMSQSLFIFLPFQEGVQPAGATTWDRSTGWSINGYTWKTCQTAHCDGQISWCYSISHPQGILSWNEKQPFSLLTVCDDTVQSSAIFQDIDSQGNIMFPLCCNASNVAFISNNTMSCYNINDLQQECTVILEGHNHVIFNFGDNFLVKGTDFLAGGDCLHFLQLVTPELTIGPKIGFPNILSYPDYDVINFPKEDVFVDQRYLNLSNLSSDNDTIVMSVRNYNNNNNPHSLFVISNVSNNQPITTPVSFLPKGYNEVGLYLKNNFIFTIATCMDDQSVGEKSGVLSIYNLANQQLWFELLFPAIPQNSYFVGNTIFVDAITASEKLICDGCDSEDCQGFYFKDIRSLLGFNIARFLV